MRLSFNAVSRWLATEGAGCTREQLAQLQAALDRASFKVPNKATSKDAVHSLFHCIEKPWNIAGLMTESSVDFKNPITSGIERLFVAAQICVDHTPVFRSPNHAQARFREFKLSHSFMALVLIDTIEDRKECDVPEVRTLL